MTINLVWISTKPAVSCLTCFRQGRPGVQVIQQIIDRGEVIADAWLLGPPDLRLSALAGGASLAGRVFAAGAGTGAGEMRWSFGLSFSACFLAALAPSPEAFAAAACLASAAW